MSTSPQPSPVTFGEPGAFGGTAKPHGGPALTTREQLATRISALPAFNLRLGAKVDIINLPVADRDLIVELLRQAEELRGLAARADELAERIGGLTGERDRLATERGMAAAALGDALDALVRLLNHADDAAGVAEWLRHRHPEQAAALRPMQMACSWQPIASAPRDNSPIFLIGRHPPGYWVAPVASRRNMISADAGIDQWLDWTYPFVPSHWSPLPDPPALAAADEVGGSVAPLASRLPDEQAWLREDLLFLSAATETGR